MGEVSNLSSQLLATCELMFSLPTRLPLQQQTASVYVQVSFMAAGVNQVKPCVAILSSSVKQEQPHLPTESNTRQS